jgi:hypothetical protein
MRPIGDFHRNRRVHWGGAIARSRCQVRRRGTRLIEHLDQHLKEWARTVVPDVEIRLTPPNDSEPAPAVYFYLLDLLPDASCATGGRFPVLQLGLRYLVTVLGDSPQEAHQILGRLVFAAMGHPEFNVELDPPAAGFWSALGIVPRPAFMLRAPLRLERREPSVRRVRKPAEVRHSELTSLMGLVVGPGELPVCDARVELGSPRLSTRTDSGGAFRFAAVPAEPRRKELRIRAKGCEQTVTVEHGAGDSKPLVIHLDTLEI